MIHLTIGETIALQECRRVLEQTLASLDDMGAGIAAIHVNAAIEQVKCNLEMIEGARQQALRSGRLCAVDRSEVTL